MGRIERPGFADDNAVKSKVVVWKACLISLVVALSLTLIPGLAFAAESSAGNALKAGSIAGSPIKAQWLDYVDDGVCGTCDWYVYDSDQGRILYIMPSNGSSGTLDSIYFDDYTYGSTAPWYGYSSSLNGIIVSGNVVAGASCECMFCDCDNLLWANLSSLDTSRTTDMSFMFYDCSSLRVIWVTEKWSTKNLVSSDYMFVNCYSLVGGNGTEFISSSTDALFANVDTDNDPGYLTSTSLTHATVQLSSWDFTYDGLEKRPAVTVRIGKTTLESGSDYSVTYSNNINAGMATVTVAGVDFYSGSRSVSYRIAQAPNYVNVSKASVKKTVKAKTLNKKAKNISLPMASSASGQCRWVLVSKDKKKTLKLAGNKIRVKKKAKKGTYKIKVRAIADGTINYPAASSRTVTVKVVVK